MKNTDYYTIGTKRNETRYFLSLSLVSFFSFSSFFFAHSNSPKLPTKNGKLNRNPRHFPHVSSNYHPPPPRSVAVRTIIAAWIIAESNNKRPWSPPLPRGFCDLTVQRNGRNYELFNPPSLLWKLRARFENGRGGRSDPSLGSKFVEIYFFWWRKKKEIVEEFFIIIYLYKSNIVIKNT